MSRHDGGEIEMELLQSLESLRILAQIGEIEITELLFENTVTIKDFLLWEKHEDTIRPVRGTQINRLHSAALQFEVTSHPLVREDEWKRWITRRSFLHVAYHFVPVLHQQITRQFGRDNFRSYFFKVSIPACPIRMVVGIDHFHDRLWSNLFYLRDQKLCRFRGPCRADDGHKTVADIHHRVFLQVETVFDDIEMALQRCQNHSWISREDERRAQKEHGKNLLHVVNTSLGERIFQNTSTSKLSLRSGAYDDLVHVNIGGLLDREHDSSGNRVGRDPHFVHAIADLDLHFRTGHGFREICPNEAR